MGTWSKDRETDRSTEQGEPGGSSDETVTSAVLRNGAHGASNADVAFDASGNVIVAGRAESWASDYVARVALHRDQIRAETAKLDWLFSTHTTSRSAAELLLFLHGGMMVNKGGARTTTVKAGRSA